MARIRSVAIAVLAACIAALPLGAPAQADGPIEPFLGSFVGSGKARTADRAEEEVRDLDVTIEPYREDGFTITWITVVRDASGERTGEDVKRREVEETFVPVEDREGVFVLATKGGLFQKAETPDPMTGDPLRWASIDGRSMTVYSIAVAPNGSAEMQVYRRTLSEKGMDVAFVRLMDARVVVRMTGELVRTK